MTALILITVLVSIGMLWVFAKWMKIRNYWSIKNVAHTPPHPVLGSLTFLLKQNPAYWMLEMYNRFRSPYVGIWLFWRPALIINSPEIARRVLVKDAAVFRDRFLSGGKKDPIGNSNLFTANDPLWTSTRRRLTAVFTAAKLRNVHSLFNLKGKELLQRIKMEMIQNNCVNLRIAFTDYTTDVIGTASFGVSSEATLTGESALRAVTKDFMEFSVMRGLSWTSIFFFPAIVDIFGFTLFPKSATDYFRKVFRQIVAQRGGYDVEISDNGDLFDALRKMKQECDKNNEDMSEDRLIAQAAVFLQGGFDTTGSALTFCTYELAFHPHIQDQLYKELKETTQKLGCVDFDASVLSDLKYLNCVMKETLRKYPPMGWLDRIAATDYEIDEHLTIPAGTPIYVNAVGMHYDEEYFENPKKFDPDRFLNENEKNIKPFTYIPFGEGPRTCIGRRFAIQNFLSTMANIVYTYKILPKANTPLPSEVEIEKNGFFLSPGQHLFVEFVPRD